MSALDAAGPQAARIAALWWLMLWGCVVVFALVLAALAWAVLHARADARRPPPPPVVYPGAERLATFAVSLATMVKEQGELEGEIANRGEPQKGTGGNSP